MIITQIFGHLFQLFCQDITDNVSDLYLITNDVSYNDKKVNCLYLSKDNSWSESVKQALKQINSEYVLFTLEDFLVKEEVKTDKIKKGFDNSLLIINLRQFI